ncbi:MAG: hypothetical protein JO108_16285, partial [Acidobacteriaceae bacterium]|nr:hypothetical protein [Acidobacteriaceae bacterium]
MSALPTRHKRLVAATFVLFGLAANSYALDPSRPVTQYARDVWGLRNGLPRGQIRAITQTADGFLWIGTEQGARRFDGFTFTLPQDSGTEPFALDRILGIVADRAGSLWFRLPEPTLVRYEKGLFTAMRVRPGVDSLATAMVPAADGTLLFATRLDGILRWNGWHFESTAPQSALPPSPIISIAASGNGDIWLGTVDAGLLRLRSRVITKIAAGLPDLKVNCMLADERGDLYVGTDHGLALWDGTRFTQAGLPRALRRARILSVAKDRDANLWLGTGYDLLRFNAQGLSGFDETGSAKAVSALFEDREGNVWVGRSDQLERIRERAFVAYSPDRYRGEQRGGPIHTDANGQIWAVLGDRGLYKLGNGGEREIAIPNFGQDEVYSIAGDGTSLWVGRKDRGLTHLIFRPGVTSSRTYTKADGLSQDSVYVVHQSRDGTIWAGTLAGGASHFKDGRFTKYTVESGLPSNTIFSIAEDWDGKMWFATPSGLSSFAKDQWTTYGTLQGLPSENVNTLFKDSAGILWVGTVRGIAFIRAGSVFVPASPKSLRNEIYAIAEDRLGSLWVTTSQGVLRVDRAKLVAGTVLSADVREFGAADGLTEPAGIRREHSITVDLSGRVWLSTPGGIGFIDPARVRRTARPTIVQISRVLLDGEAHDPSTAVWVPPGSRRIVIEYQGLNLAAPEGVQFRFKLDGFDPQWSAPGAMKEAVYTNLGAGSYRFHVTASNADQVWSEMGATFSFRVDPTLWQTWWFRSAAAAALALAAIGFYQLRIRQITEQVNSRFEARLAERTRIARELHDTLLQSFHGLMLRFQSVEDFLPGKPAQAKASLAIAIERAGRAITEARDAVQALRCNELTRNDLLETLTSLGHELASTGDGNAAPSFRVLVEGAPRQLNPSLKEDLYRISREAVANAFRHSQASSIELDIRYDARVLRLRVRDNGIGMDSNIMANGGRDGHWGIPGMQERARA